MKPEAIMNDIKLDYSKITNIVFDGIDHKDYPDYCDAYITSADYNGVPMDEDMLERIDSQFVYEALMEHLY